MIILLYYLDTPEPLENEWLETAQQFKNSGMVYEDIPAETFPVVYVKRNAKSAKSHIFRKDKIEAE